MFFPISHKYIVEISFTHTIFITANFHFKKQNIYLSIFKFPSSFFLHSIQFKSLIFSLSYYYSEQQHCIIVLLSLLEGSYAQLQFHPLTKSLLITLSLSFPRKHTSHKTRRTLHALFNFTWKSFRLLSRCSHDFQTGPATSIASGSQQPAAQSLAHYLTHVLQLFAPVLSDPMLDLQLPFSYQPLLFLLISLRLLPKSFSIPH